MEKGKSVTEKYYKDVVLKKLKVNTTRNGAQPHISNMSDFYFPSSWNEQKLAIPESIQ